MAIAFQKRKKFLANIYGPPGTGKTTFGASVSSYWPSDFLDRQGMRSPRVELNDIVIVEFDFGGTEALSSENIWAPTIDFEEKLRASDDDLGAALDSMFEDLREAEPEFILFDTLTALDKHINAKFSKYLEEDASRQGGYAKVANYWRDFHLDVKRLKSGILYLSHAKFLDEDRKRKDGSLLDPNAKKKAKAVRSDVGVNIFPDITGSSKDLLKGDESLRIVCRKRYDEGKNPIFERHTTSTDGFEAKSRYRHIEDIETRWLREILKAEGIVN